MSKTVARFATMLEQMGSEVIFHREAATVPCPCRTPEGFRDPSWHRSHGAQVCNEQGFLDEATEFTVKASIQPAFSGLFRQGQRANDLLGEVRRDDKIGIFPCSWSGNVLDFDDWSDAGEDFIIYDGKRYMVVASDKLPDVDGDPAHHFEVGLRLIKTLRPAPTLAGYGSGDYGSETYTVIGAGYSSDSYSSSDYI